MSISSEHKALIFVGVVAVLGGGVRLARARRPDAVPGAQPALEHQIAASDSAKKAKSKRSRSAARRPLRSNSDSAMSAAGGSKRAARDHGLLDRPGYVGGKLDLDVATAPQVDSLPGVSSAMARRIVADRMQRGPFLSIDGLRRVPGAGPTFIARIDSLVMFSGSVRQPSPTDSVIPPRRRAKRGGKAKGG
ncbi:MAG TPA: helix-hairpin-helix domain-containing protein [Gemmatimonadaceae bacterium]|nr:helix-hairpin-helix domain-containing protein [Gemmatimonadaceae bacterium]